MSNLVAKLDHLIKFATDLKAEVVAAERQHNMMEPDRRALPVRAPTMNATDPQTVNKVAVPQAPVRGRQLPTGPLNPDLVKARQPRQSSIQVQPSQQPQAQPPQAESPVTAKKARAKAQAEAINKGPKILNSKQARS